MQTEWQTDEMTSILVTVLVVLIIIAICLTVRWVLNYPKNYYAITVFYSAGITDFSGRVIAVDLNNDKTDDFIFINRDSVTLHLSVGPRRYVSRCIFLLDDPKYTVTQILLTSLNSPTLISRVKTSEQRAAKNSKTIMFENTGKAIQIAASRNDDTSLQLHTRRIGIMARGILVLDPADTGEPVAVFDIPPAANISVHYSGGVIEHIAGWKSPNKQIKIPLEKTIYGLPETIEKLEVAIAGSTINLPNPKAGTYTYAKL